MNTVANKMPPDMSYFHIGLYVLRQKESEEYLDSEWPGAGCQASVRYKIYRA